INPSPSHVISMVSSPSRVIPMVTSPSRVTPLVTSTSSVNPLLTTPKVGPLQPIHEHEEEVITRPPVGYRLLREPSISLDITDYKPGFGMLAPIDEFHLTFHALLLHPTTWPFIRMMDSADNKLMVLIPETKNPSPRRPSSTSRVYRNNVDHHDLGTNLEWKIRFNNMQDKEVMVVKRHLIVTDGGYFNNPEQI
ncbi:unnamed protein product, partial [Meganyctiphanes norvegica]